MKFSTSLRAAPLLAACVLAKTNMPDLPEDLTTPVQQRLALYGPDAVSIGWNTFTKLNETCVEYGSSSRKLNKKACSSVDSTTYPTSRTYENVVILTDLKPAKRYYYKIVSTNSTMDHFMSPRAAGDDTPFSMNAVIDLGVYGEGGFTLQGDKSKRDTIPTIDPALTHTTIGRLATTANDYELVIHPGDFAYADDWILSLENLGDGENAYQAILENFYTQLAPIAGRKPYMASPGNHEAACQEIPFTTASCPIGQRNFTDFMHRFGKTMPTTFPSVSSKKSANALADKARALALPPFWYSFEYGMAHIVMINTETDFDGAPDGQDGSAGLDGGPFGATHQQLQFLEADLASVDRKVTPWLIVAGHRPWYTTGSACTTCATAFEGLMYKYGVDLGVFGHEHNSQRFLPVFNGTADPKGLKDPKAPMYIVSGAAGNIEGLDAIDTKPSFMEFGNDKDHAYANIKFLDKHNLQVDFINSLTGEVLDTSTLYKKHSKRFVEQ
ncbi:Metallo-dependent phosphatase-like protein [Aspergillus varians]